MPECKRCGTVCLKKDNYCSKCGAPLKAEIFKMVRQAYEKRRREAVHKVLTLLVSEGCINKKSLDKMMEKLERLFGRR